MTKPSIIHDEHFNSARLCFLCNCKKLLCVEIKICRLPVIDQDRTLAMVIRTANHVASIKIVITSGHLSKTLWGVNTNYLWCLEWWTRRKLPAKFLSWNSHDHTHHVKLCTFCLRDKVSRIHKMHCVNLTVFLIAPLCDKCLERMLLMTGFSL